MIKLYRKTSCPLSDRIAKKLTSLVIAHQIIDMAGAASIDGLPDEIEFPVLKDGNQIIHGVAAIDAYLAKLENVMRDWQKYQSDSCYSDDGDIC